MNRRFLLLFVVALPFVSGLALFLLTGGAAAQSFTLDLGGGGGGGGGGGTMTGRVVQLLGLMTVLSLAPSILVMMTCFTRIIIVLSFLRTAMGIQQVPPNT
ncbi:MAG: flagellar biosynthetic protein FliP, partial [Rhodospirillaceae bacterium]